jgi:hypothetical protein
MNLVFYFKSFPKKMLPVLVLLLLLYTALAVVIIYFLLIRQTEDSLEKAAGRLKEDIALKNGIWDVSSYNADSSISDENPLYIITSEGFIIERSRPIHGLLDLSRYSVIDNYTVPQTLTTVTNEKWRVFSVPLMAEDKAVGIVMVATYDPDERHLAEIDQKIQEIVSQIRSNITVKEDLIDVSKIDIRKIPFDTSFQIVNRFNKVLLQSHNSNSVSRIPSFIDRSYIENQLKGSPKKQVEDSTTHKKYLTLSTPILDEKKLVAGLVVVGKPIGEIYWAIALYAVIIFFINILLAILSIPVTKLYLKRLHKQNDGKNREKALPKAILFMKKACKLSIVEIPYASFQYYFCEALFLRPKKRWEVDELLEIFGEDFGIEKWRKVYDTMVALDKKTSDLVHKLFMVKDKRYFVNPRLLPIIRYVNN